MGTVTLHPAMPHRGLAGHAGPQAGWAGARWVGSISTQQLAGLPQVAVASADGYPRARLLVRDGRHVLGYIDVAIHDGLLDDAELHHGIHNLLAARIPERPEPALPAPLPEITVVVCTRERPEHLRDALNSILALDYPDFTVLVVDNAPTTTATRDLLRDEFTDQRLRRLAEPMPGVSRARNTGLRHADGAIVAFVDDDVVVDRAWLREIAAAFADRPDVACVTGLVPTGELATPVQGYFDRRVSWSKNLTPRRFSLSDPPADLPLFPFSVGAFGTGANVAVRRSAAVALGGFDVDLGPGTLTGGGEDLDLFVRMLVAGHTLTVQPSAIAWHRHRSDMAALSAQARGYGLGLGAWIAKIAARRDTARLAFQRTPQALARLRQVLLGKSARQGIPTTHDLAGMRRSELAALTRGPYRYARERLARTAALPAGSTSLPRLGPPPEPGLACIVLAHTDPIQVRRLLGALDPFPVFLHVDSRTPDSVYQAMLAGRPERCLPLERRRTGWARWENVVAEIEGYRAALALTRCSHLALLTGTDYPLASAEEIRDLMAQNLGRSFASIDTLPHPAWGQDHGFARLRYRHWALGKHMVRLPIPRRMPRDVVFAGGSQLKILSREHARAIVDAYDRNPRLARFWKRSWIPDETFIPTLLSTRRFVPEWEDEHVPAAPWWIDWSGTSRKSPAWLGPADVSRVLSRRVYDTQPAPAIFARKFQTGFSTPLLDAIDRELLGRQPGRPTGSPAGPKARPRGAAPVRKKAI